MPGGEPARGGPGPPGARPRERKLPLSLRPGDVPGPAWDGAVDSRTPVTPFCRGAVRRGLEATRVTPSFARVRTGKSRAELPAKLRFPWRRSQGHTWPRPDRQCSLQAGSTPREFRCRWRESGPWARVAGHTCGLHTQGLSLSRGWESSPALGAGGPATRAPAAAGTRAPAQLRAGGRVCTECRPVWGAAPRLGDPLRPHSLIVLPRCLCSPQSGSRSDLRDEDPKPERAPGRGPFGARGRTRLCLAFSACGDGEVSLPGVQFRVRQA